MKLFFGQNLSYKLCHRLSDLYLDSSQARLVGLNEAADRDIWNHAKQNDFVLVTLDADFADLAALYGPPPKVILLRCGNQKTSVIEQLLRVNSNIIEAFTNDETSACLEIF